MQPGRATIEIDGKPIVLAKADVLRLEQLFRYFREDTWFFKEG